ncbi:MAG: radical SAM protein [Elusimicrobiota bacterium]|jgi:MoaA/NifB/PqqE/SkfB family radical SAM enzyme
MRSPVRVLRRFALLHRVFVARTGARGHWNVARFAAVRWLAGRRVPMTVMAALTYRCQCDCAHCAVAGRGFDERPELSTAETKALLDDAHRLGVPKAGFTGGEPLLRADLPELVAHAASLGMSVSIDTNGLLLDAAAARRLAGAGLSNAAVSVDRPDPASHDRLRRSEGCLEKALAAIGHCRAAGLPCVVSTYATDRSLESGDLGRVIALARERGASAVRVLFPVYTGRFHGGPRLLSDANMARFFREFVDDSFVTSESPLFDELTGRMECTMQRRLSVYVSPFGEVRACYASERPMGSLREKALSRILEESGWLDAPADSNPCGV